MNARLWCIPLLALLMAPGPATALCTFYTDPKFPTISPEVLDTVIHVEIHDGYAITEIKKTFHNPDPSTNQVGDIIFPLPSDHAFITALSLGIDGEWHNGTLVGREEGRQNFSKAVDEQRDASLLEYLGGSQYALRVTLPPNSDRTLLVRYEEPLFRQDGTYRYRYPLTEEALSKPKHLHIDIEASTLAEFQRFDLVKPSHLVLQRPSPSEAALAFETDSPADLAQDIILEWDVASQAPVQYFVDSVDGGTRFVLRVLPQARSTFPLDVVVLVDASGSMDADDRFNEAVAATQQILNGLQERDQFQVAVFNRRVTPLSSLNNAYPSAIKAAVEELRAVQPHGSTNLQAALKEGIDLLPPSPPGRQKVLVVVSDENGTVGVREGHLLLHQIVDRDPSVQVHSIAVASSDRAPLRFDPWGRRLEGAEPAIQQLARELQGTTAPAETPRGVERALRESGRLLGQDITLTLSGDGVVSFQPTTIPMLLAGGELILAGNLSHASDLELVATGTGPNGEAIHWTWDVAAQDALAHPLAGRIGAMIQLRELLAEIDFHGQTPELREAVLAIAAEYGFVTPFTSFLVDIREASRADSAASQGAPLTMTMSTVGARRMYSDLDGWYGMTVEEFRAHPIVASNEIDRFVVLDSPAHRLLLQRAQVVAGGGNGPSILDDEGELVGVADLDTIASLSRVKPSPVHYDVPFPGAVAALAAIAAFALLRRLAKP